MQPKLTVGRSDDVYEQEADHVADQVMRMPAGAPVVQRACDSCNAGQDDEETVQRAPLPISSAPNPVIARAELADLRVYDDALPDPAAGPASAQVPQAPDEADTEEAQRTATGVTAPTPGPRIERSIEQARSAGGQPLARDTRAALEPRFGYDFSEVRIHADREADELSRGLSARAFTLRNDVFFASGEYRPGSAAGMRLLAHELTHVVQQRGGSGLQPRVQRTEADTLAGCPRYWRYEMPRLVETYNCAGLAFRTYDFRGNRTAERAAMAAGRSIAASASCAAGEVKHWFWEYDMHAEVPGLGNGPSGRDFHTVAGVTRPGGGDPDDVYSKNGGRPVYGPATGPSFQPPARERDTTSDSSESPTFYQNNPAYPIYKVRANISQSCACFPCPARSP